MEHVTDIAIVGGGLNGPALALACARAGLRSAVIDSLPTQARRAEGFDGRAYALARASQRMLAALGLWDGLADHAQPMAQIRVSDGRVADGFALLGLDFASAELEDGPMGFMLEDRHLRPALMAALAAEPLIAVMDGTTVTGQQVHPDHALLQLSGGHSLRARLIVGADGRQSGTARRAGIGRTGWDYRQSALVCAIDHEHPHGGAAHQLFLPNGPLAILPLPGNRSSIVWSEDRALAERIHALPDDAYLQALRPRFGSFLGRITLAGKRHIYPLNLTLARSFTAPRVALVGDAAHGMHPIAGQGLNAGLRDVAALADVLAQARARGEDFASAPVLDRYAQWRRFDTATLAASTDLFNRLFSNNSAVLRGLRDIGMQLVNATPALRRGAIREAAGLTGDLPELMRGQP